MKKIIIANWKLNPTTWEEAENLFEAVKRGLGHFENSEVIICPPFVYLPLLKGVTLGAQNVFSETKGAFTGEISPAMLSDLGVEYVLIGHSERRKMGESNELINQKIKASLQAGLKVVLCVGEKEGEDKKAVLDKQIQEGLVGISPEDVANMMIAYEPVWAIGTGKNCGVKETLEALEIIRNNNLEKNILLYGGSVKVDNAGEYLKEEAIGGLLVGGASLKAEEFLAIVGAF